MTLRDARAAATQWVEDQAATIPELVGAYMDGSVRSRPEGDLFPETSDVDLRMAVDAEVLDPMAVPTGRWRPQKLLYRGVVLEPYYLSWQAIRDPHAVLAHSELAPALAKACIVKDPEGKIEGVHQAVAAEFARTDWVRRRCEHSQAGVLGSCDMALDPPAVSGWQPPLGSVGTLLIVAVPRLAQIPCIGALADLTTRKALVRSRAVLSAHGRADLHEAVLSLLGSSRMSPGDVERHLAELEDAYDAAVAVVRTPFHCDTNLSTTSRNLALRGARELVDSGDHREAMSWIAFLRVVAQNALANDAPRPLSDRYLQGYSGLLSSLGLSSGRDVRERVEALRSLVPTVMRVTHEIIEAHPEITRLPPDTERTG